MNIQFVGGPFDGLVMDAIEFEKLDSLITISTQRGPRRFVFLPDPLDWPEIRTGKLPIRNSSRFYYYEIVNTFRGPECQFDPGDARFRAAVLDA